MMTSAPPSSSNADDREHIPAEYEPLTEHTAAYFKWYSTAAARLVFQLDTLDTMPADQLQISIAAREYPRGEIQAVDESDPFSVRSDTDEVDIEIEYSIDPATLSGEFLLGAFLYPASKTLERALNDETIVYLAETNRLTTKWGNLVKHPHPDAKDSLETDTYTRIAGEGAYLIQLSGEVDFGVTLSKSAYSAAASQSTGAVPAVVSTALTADVIQTLSQIIHSAAENAGFTTPREKLDYCTKAIRAFPNQCLEETGRYDYCSRLPVETFVEGGGDYEDRAVLLVSILEAPPFNYDCILVYHPFENPAQVGIGIASADAGHGRYYEYDDKQYHYVGLGNETQGRNEIPEPYRDEPARIMPIG